MSYSIDSNAVSHERMQDEVIIIHLVEGAYYSGTGAAADLWSLITSGLTSEAVTERLAALYGQQADDIRNDVGAAIAFLVQRGILAERPPVPAQSPELPDVGRAVWTAPVYDEYTDMWDLLKVDPIHEVGEAGWPFAPTKTN